MSQLLTLNGSCYRHVLSNLEPLITHILFLFGSSLVPLEAICTVVLFWREKPHLNTATGTTTTWHFLLHRLHIPRIYFSVTFSDPFHYITIPQVLLIPSKNIYILKKERKRRTNMHTHTQNPKYVSSES